MSPFPPDRRLVAALVSMTALGAIAPAAGPDDLARDRAIKAAAREAAREAFDEMTKTDDFRILLCLPLRWENRLDEFTKKQFLIKLLHELFAVEQHSIRNMERVEVPGRNILGQHGNIVLYQDIHFVNGRCAWAIEKLLSKQGDEIFKLRFEPLDQKPFLDAEALNKLPSEELQRITHWWEWVSITAELNANPVKLAGAVDTIHKIVIQRMRLPARLRTVRDDPASDPDALARSELDEFLTKYKLDYQQLCRATSRWSDTLAETTIKHLVLRLLDRLSDPMEASKILKNNQQIIIFSKYSKSKTIGFPLQSVLLEQDITVVNGRCAWALERLLGITLPSFDADLVKDEAKLRAAIREAHCRVIEAMELPEKPWVKKFREE